MIFLYEGIARFLNNCQINDFDFLVDEILLPNTTRKVKFHYLANITFLAAGKFIIVAS